MTPAKTISLYRYPVKGLSAEPLVDVQIEAGEMLPGDRAYAIENGSRDFDALSPGYLPKQKFLQLMTNEDLAALETRFDADTQTMKILRNGRQVSMGNLSTPIGCQLVEQFLSAYLARRVRGALRIVSAPDHHFADAPDRFISLINLASLRDLERITGKTVDPLRFRANIYIDGWPAWQERTLIGQTLEIGGTAHFHVAEAITRCAATNVDPQTGARDMHIPRTLGDVFGHEECGLYLTAISSGPISQGDEVKPMGKLKPVSAGSDLGIR